MGAVGVAGAGQAGGAERGAARACAVLPAGEAARVPELQAAPRAGAEPPAGPGREPAAPREVARQVRSRLTPETPTQTRPSPSAAEVVVVWRVSSTRQTLHPYSDERVANRTLRLGTRRQRMVLERWTNQTFAAYVYMHVESGYSRVEGIRRASRDGRVSSSPTRNPYRHDSQLSPSL